MTTGITLIQEAQEARAKWEYSANTQQSGDFHACNCIGPQNGQPACPCMMRSVTIENGRYVRKQDLGAAPARSGAVRAGQAMGTDVTHPSKREG